MFVECDVCGENYEVANPCEDEEYIGHVCDSCAGDDSDDDEEDE